MKKARNTAALAALLGAGLAGCACADSRGYAWTYDYTTARKGMAELEYYVTSRVRDTGDPAAGQWEHQLELEYGMTDRTDLALYQMFKQDGAGNGTLRYDGLKLRMRHRLSERGTLPVDTLFYLEYVRDADLARRDELEAKLVLARDIGRLNLVYNQIEELKLGGSAAAEHGFSAAAGWTFSPLFSAGAEFTGSYGEKELYLGPTLHFQEPYMKFYANLGFLSGLNPESKDAQTRLILGLPF